MPCQLDWCQLKPNGWAFWSIKHDDELQYQQIISAADSVVSTSAMVKLRIKSLMAKMLIPHTSLVQFWSPIQVNGSTFLSTADQLFVFNKELDTRLSSYRRLCLDTLIPIDYYKEALVAPPLCEFSEDGCQNITPTSKATPLQSFHCFKLQFAWDYILIMHFHSSNSLISGALVYLRLYLHNHLSVFPTLLRG